MLTGQDWDTFAVDSDDPALTRAIVHARADTIPSPREARHARALLLDHGFIDVTAEALTAIFTGPAMLPMLAGLAHAACAAGAVSSDQAGTWIAEQTRRARADRLFLAIPVFTTSATRPA